jgi:FkbM family methyltransferase
VLAEFFYQALKPTWTTLSLGETTCRFTMDPATISARDFRGAFESEREVLDDLLRSVTADDVFWDVGANVGVYTCFVSSRISDSSNLIAFEPHPDIRSYLMKNIKENAPKSRIVPYGLSSTEQTQELSEIGLAGHTIADTGDHETVEIDLVTAQSATEDRGLPQPTVVKMDIEGAELAALNGFGSVLDHVRLLYCEVHPKRLKQMGISGDEVESLLLDSGFNVEHLGDRGDTYFLRCTRTSN